MRGMHTLPGLQWVLGCLQADANGFAEYMFKYGNTICGKHPIGLFLQVLYNLQFQIIPLRSTAPS